MAEVRNTWIVLPSSVRTDNILSGKYQVNINKILVSVTETVLDSVIMEKFCSKTARVFRYIRSNKYVEEGALQGAVMIPSKETKEITYKVRSYPANVPPADQHVSAPGESLHPPAGAAEDDLEHGTHQVPVPLLC